MKYSANTLHLLSQSGLSRIELQNLQLDPILKFDIVSTGFGLVGPTGTGKTIALARMAADYTELLVGDRGEGARYPCGDAILWMNWPESAELFKRWAVGGDPEHSEGIIERAKDVGYLYLDDLGQERSKGEEDLSTGILKEILDSRYRDGKPVFWTSNLDKVALANFYGARTVSRMAEAWPGQRVTGVDMRLK